MTVTDDKARQAQEIDSLKQAREADRHQQEKLQMAITEQRDEVHRLTQQQAVDDERSQSLIRQLIEVREAHEVLQQRLDAAESAHRDTTEQLTGDLQKATNQVARLTTQGENAQRQETELKRH